MSAAKSLQRAPWLSLLLLIATYTTFGWFMAALEAEPYWQWLGGAVVLIVQLALLAPIELVEFLFGGWLRTDSKAMLTIINLALISVFALRWFHWFLRVTILVAAGVLARLDLRAAGCNRWLAFAIESVLGLGGYFAGLQLHGRPEIAAAIARLG